MIKLLHGDCRELLDGVLADCNNPIVVSDPPFNIGYKYKTYKDKMPEGEYLKFMSDTFCKIPSVIIHYPDMLYKIAIRMGYAPERVVSWVYNSNTAKQHRDIAFFKVKPDFSKIRQPYKNPNDKRIKRRVAEGKTGAKLYDWWYIDQVKNVNKDKTAIPCQMPLEVMKMIIGILPDDVCIIDPFMGSGTTGIACLALGRDFVGIEMDDEYFGIAEERIHRYSLLDVV